MTIRPLTAVILAAGYGRRMRPLTDECHKTLLTIGGTTILGRILDGLSELGVDDILVVTGYREPDIRGFVAEHRASATVRFVHNDRYDSTNNIVSLALAFAELDFTRDLILIESDLIFDPSVLEALLIPGDDNLALVDRFRAGMDGTVVAVEDGLVSQVFPPHLQGRQFRYDDKFKTLNIYRFNRVFCRERFGPLLECYANFIDGNAYYELVLGMLVNMQRERIRAIEVQGDWAEVDDPNDLEMARYVFEPGNRVELLGHAAGGYWSFDVLDFHYLRNMHFPPHAVMAAMRDALPQVLLNYGSRQGVLDQKLAWHLLCDPRHVRLLHGVAQVYPMLPRLLSDRHVIVPRPTFGEYKRMFPDALSYDDTFSVDLVSVVIAAPIGSAIVVVNPNNPTGTLVPGKTIHRLAASRPDVLFVVDESFLDFAGEVSLLELLGLEPLPNVLVLKSLSKTLGVPGLRIGYVFAQDPMLLAAIDREIPIWNMSGPAEFFLELSLKFRPELAASFVRTAADRRDLVGRLRHSGAVKTVQEGHGNFVVVELHGTDDTATRVTAGLLERHRIHVKDLTGRFVHVTGPWLRLSVRLADEHERLVTALEEEHGRALEERHGHFGEP